MDLVATLGLKPPRHLASLDVMDLVPRLSACLPIMMGAHVLFHQVGLPMEAVATLFVVVTAGVCLAERVYKNGWLWIGVALVMGAWQAAHWYGLDDHLVLVTYWCLGLGLSLLTPQPQEAMRIASRWLIAGVFGFAVLWKGVAPQFASGDFFDVAFLVLDERFHFAATALGGIDEATYQAQAQAYAGLRGYGSDAAAMTLAVTPRLHALATLLAWMTFLVEGALALVFLLPAPTPRRRFIRAATVATFCVTTYSLVSVLMFGWVLVAMGYSQLDDTQRGAQRMMLAALGYVLFLALLR